MIHYQVHIYEISIIFYLCFGITLLLTRENALEKKFTKRLKIPLFVANSSCEHS